jgi:Ca2+-binding RTX toxin-like protein
VVIELAGQGFDTVISRVASYTLPDNVEKLMLDDALPSAFNGSGNALDNDIVGNRNANHLAGGDGNDHLWGANGDDVIDGGEGDDYLIGGPGNDTMIGGAGFDTYWVSAGDVVIGDQVDTVYGVID